MSTKKNWVDAITISQFLFLFFDFNIKFFLFYQNSQTSTKVVTKIVLNASLRALLK